MASSQRRVVVFSYFFMLVGLWASHSPRKLVGEVNPNMLGIIIGTAATIGACVYFSRRRRCASRNWYGGHCGHHGRHHWGRADFGSRGPGRWAAMLADR